jgi:hypothetical protein
MTIRAQRIIDKLSQYCPSTRRDLREMLWYLYVEEGLSIRRIADMLQDEASWSWVRRTLRKMGFTLRGRGGPHLKYPAIPNLEEEAKTLMPKEIALKYNLPAEIVYRRLKRLTQELSREGDDTSQE